MFNRGKKGKRSKKITPHLHLYSQSLLSLVKRFSYLLYMLLLPMVLTAAEPAGRLEFMYAKKLIEERFYDLAAEQLEKVLRDYPNLPEADEAQFLLGEVYLKSGDTERAKAAFLRTAIVYPQSPWAPQALFKVAETYEREGQLREAGQVFERVEGFYSGSRWAPEALFKASVVYARAGDEETADNVLNRIIGQYPESIYASLARLKKAEVLERRKDHISAEHYLKWVAERSGNDTLQARAWFELGGLYQRQFHFNRALEAYEKCYQQYPATIYAVNARLQASSLLNWRGKPEASLDILAPLLTHNDFKVRIKAIEKLGDAAYLRRQYEMALAHYDSASPFSPSAQLKAAWVCEILGTRQTALQRYQKFISSPVPDTALYLTSLVRAAILSVESSAFPSAKLYWEEFLRQKRGASDFDRALYEYLLRAPQFDGNKSVLTLVDSFLVRSPYSPLSDDILYYSALLAYRNKDYPSAVERWEKVVKSYPYSPYADSAGFWVNFVRRSALRGEGLLERMAELSSIPPGRTNPVKWALDWGDFYLDLFKDPVKAIDQYQRALDDVNAGLADRLHAIKRSTEAFLLLYESALRDNDEFASEMYEDSTRQKLEELKHIDQGGAEFQKIYAQYLLLRLFLRSPYPQVVELLEEDQDEISLLNMVSDAIDRYRLERVNPMLVWVFLNSALTSLERFQIDPGKLVSLSERAYQAISDSLFKGRIKCWQGEFLKEQGKTSQAVDTFRIVVQEFPETPLLPQALKELIASPVEDPSLLREYRRLLVDKAIYALRPEEYYRLQAQIKEDEGKWEEALVNEEKAVEEEKWGIPYFPELELFSPQLSLKRARAFKKMGWFERAHEELWMVLSLVSEPKWVASALLELADLERLRMNYKEADRLVDSLLTHYAQTPEANAALYLKLETTLRLNQYASLMETSRLLSQRSLNADSLFRYSQWEFIALYRLGKEEEAKRKLNQALKQFKDRKDLNDLKSLALLEEGLKWEKSKEWDKARAKYQELLAQYGSSLWAPQAAFQLGSSYYQQGKFSDAAKAFESMVASYPESELVWSALLLAGSALYQAERYGEALNHFKKVWDDKRASAYWQQSFESLISIYRDLHLWDMALKVTREYIARFPDAPDLIDRRMDIAQFYLELQEWDEAVRHYRPLLPLADSEREAEIQYYIGEALMGKGDYKGAILEFLKVKILGRKTRLDWGITALYQAGVCYEKLQDWEGAARMYQKIIQETGEESNYGKAARQKLANLPSAQTKEPIKP